MYETRIQHYIRKAAKCEDWDPRSPEVSGQVADLIRERLPWVRTQHVGSSSVPGCAGKGIIDLQISVNDDEMQPVKDALDDLGFQRQTFGMVWPETRPMRVGAIEHDGTVFYLHVHVVPEDDPHHDDMPRFRDALRADDSLRDSYVAWKRAIIAMGQDQADEYTVAKSRWIEKVLAGERPDDAPVIAKD